MKCLEFRLPSGAGGMAAGYTRGSILSKLKKLKDENKIGVYKYATERYLLRVWLEHERDYTTFFLLWNPASSWHGPTVTEKDIPPDVCSV